MALSGPNNQKSRFHITGTLNDYSTSKEVYHSFYGSLLETQADPVPHNQGYQKEAACLIQPMNCIFAYTSPYSKK